MDDRRIFRFNDGVKNRAMDPVIIAQRYREAAKATDISYVEKAFWGPEWLLPFLLEGKNPPEDITEDAIKFSIDERETAIEKLLPILYHTFKCEPIDDEEKGTTADEIIQIWQDYLILRYDVKKNIEESPSPAITTPDSDPSTSSTPMTPSEESGISSGASSSTSFGSSRLTQSP